MESVFVDVATKVSPYQTDCDRSPSASFAGREMEGVDARRVLSGEVERGHDMTF